MKDVAPSARPDDGLAERRRIKVCIEFENAWKNGQRLSIESLCRDIPPAERLDLLAELAGIELELRRASGDLPTEAEYICRFAELAPFFPQLITEACFSHVVTATRECDKSHAVSDLQRNTSYGLLFGLLALQNNFVDREMLLTAFNRWVADKNQAIGKILVESGALNAARHDVLESLVNEHLKQHDQDPARSLAALSSIGVLRQDLEQIEDSELTSIVAQVSTGRHEPCSDETASWDQSSTLRGNRFRIVRPFDSQGNLGELFIAHDLEFHREVLVKQIKELHADNIETRGRFVLEGEVTGNLEHPGIVPVYGLGHYAEGRPYYAMRRIEGMNLKEAVLEFHQSAQLSFKNSKVSLALRTLLRHFVDACNTVAYAHSRGILHRDLKPHNIMVGQYGETFVIDWGLAKPVGRHFETNIPSEAQTLHPSSASGSPDTIAGSVVGTPQYMSPEQASGDHERVKAASDIYGLGATLYFLLTAVPPFKGNVAEVLSNVVKGEFPHPREVNGAVPRALAAICKKAMALDPKDRYSSADLLAKDIERWMADESVTAMPDPIVDSVSRWCRRHRPLVSAAAVLLIAVPIALGAIAAQKERRIAAEAARSRMEAEKELADEKASSLEKLSNVKEYFVLTSPPSEGERTQPGWTWDRVSDLTKAASLDVSQRDLKLLRSELAEALASTDVREARQFAPNLLVLEPFLPVLSSPDVSCLAFSSDGRLLALGQQKTSLSADYQVRIVDLERNTSLPTRWVSPEYDADLVANELEEKICALVFTPENTGLICATKNGWIHYFDMSRTGAKPKSWKGHDASIFGLVVSPDGRWLVSADAHKLRRWDLDTIALPVPESVTREREDSPGDDRFKEIKALPNKDSFLCANETGIRILDYESPNQDATKFLIDRHIRRLAVTPNGWAMAAGVHNKVLMFDTHQRWDVRSFLDPALQGEAHVSSSDLLRFSHIGDVLLTSSTTEQDQVVKLWEVSTGRLLLRLPMDGSVKDAMFSPDGKWLVIATSKKTTIFEIGNSTFQTTVAHQKQPISAIEIDPSGKQLMCAGEPRTPHGLKCNASLSAWETTTWLKTNHYEVEGKAREDVVNACTSLTFQPQGDYFAAIWPFDNQILIYNRITDVAPKELDAGSSSGRMAFSPDGSRLWSVSSETVKQWAASDWKQGTGWSNYAAGAFTGAKNVTCLVASNDMILVGGRDGKIRKLSDTANPKYLGIWSCFASPITSMSVDSANHLLGVGGNNGEVAAFRLPSGDLIPRVEGAHQLAVNSTSVSPDGNLIASASNDQTIKVWRVTKTTIEELLTLRPSAKPVHSVRFSADGSKIYSASYGETAIRVWDLSELRKYLKQLEIDWEDT